LKKRFWLVVLTMGLIVGLTTSLAASKLTITYWETGGNREWSELWSRKFEQANPNVRIVPEYTPAGNMAQKVMIAIASGQVPDVLKEYLGRMSAWWKHDVLESLSGTLSEQDLEDFSTSLLELLTIDGNLIGYPLPLGTRTFGANMTLLKRAGVANLMPQGDNREWTLDTFELVLEKVSQLDGVYGTGFFAANQSGDYHTLGILQMFGAYLYQDGDYTKTTLNSEEGIRGLQWMLDMVAKGYATPGPAGTTDDHHWEAIRSGRIAFGGWCPTPEQAQGCFENGMSPELYEYLFLEFPHAEGIAPPPLFIGLDIISVFKDSEVKNSATEFAQFLTSKEALEDCISRYPNASPRKSVIPPSELKFLGILQRIMEKNGVGDLGLTSSYYLEVRHLQFPEMQAAFSGVKTAKQALDDFAKGVAKLWER